LGSKAVECDKLVQFYDMGELVRSPVKGD